MNSSQDDLTHHSSQDAQGINRLPLFLHHPSTRRKLLARPCNGWSTFMNHYLQDGIGIEVNLAQGAAQSNQCFSPEEFDKRKLWANPHLISNVLSDALVLRPYSPPGFISQTN